VVYVSKIDGTRRFVYDDSVRCLLDGEKPIIRRASHVEPTPEGEWTADMSPVGGPTLGPFATRAEALGQEKAWLITNRVPVPVK